MTTRQMGWILLGAIGGVIAGCVALLLVLREWGNRFQDSVAFVPLVVLGLVIGGLVAGAYAVQAVIYRRERAAKKAKREKKRRGGRKSSPKANQRGGQKTGARVTTKDKRRR